MCFRNIAYISISLPKNKQSCIHKLVQILWDTLWRHTSYLTLKVLFFVISLSSHKTDFFGASGEGSIKNGIQADLLSE